MPKSLQPVRANALVNGSRLLTRSEVADLLHVSLTTVRRLQYAGTLRVVKLGNTVRVRLEDVIDLIESGLIG